MDAKSLSEATENFHNTAQKLAEGVHRMRISQHKALRENRVGSIMEERRRRTEAKEKYEKAKDYQLELLSALRRQYLADPEKGQVVLSERSEDIALLFNNMKHAGPPQ